MSREQIFTCDGCGKGGTWATGAGLWSKVEVTRQLYRQDARDACSEACVKKILASLAGMPMDREALAAEAEREAQRRTIETREEAKREVEQAQKHIEQARADLRHVSKAHADVLVENERLRAELEQAQKLTRQDLVDALREAMRPPPVAIDPDRVAVVFEKGISEILDRKLRDAALGLAPDIAR